MERLGGRARVGDAAGRETDQLPAVQRLRIGPAQSFLDCLLIAYQCTRTHSNVTVDGHTADPAPGCAALPDGAKQQQFNTAPHIDKRYSAMDVAVERLPFTLQPP